MKHNLGFFCLIFLLSFWSVNSTNKYSEEANVQPKEDTVIFRNLERPFRMQKLNLLWVKAQQRLTEPKLKSLYTELTIHDKEELILKRAKSEGGDSDGMREADLRKKLSNIMFAYGLKQHFEDGEHPPPKNEHFIHDEQINHNLFKDKKLNLLWTKAENAGFTNQELSALKEEFQHHQDKIDQYYELLDQVNAGKKDQYDNAIDQEEHDQFNEVLRSELEPNKEYLHVANMVRDQHRALRDGYDMLHRATAKGPDSRDFVEPKVQGLWKLALESNFSIDELESLRTELNHYESRLMKLRTLLGDHAQFATKPGSKIINSKNSGKTESLEDQQAVIRKHSEKVRKLHEDLEFKIMTRHSEL